MNRAMLDGRRSMRGATGAILTVAIVLLGAARPADDGEAAKIGAQKKTAETAWALLEIGDFAHLETAHLLVYAPKAYEKKLKDTGASLEKQRDLIVKALALDPKEDPWPGKLTVYLLSEREQFTSFIRRVEKRRQESEEVGSFVTESNQPHVAASR